MALLQRDLPVKVIQFGEGNFMRAFIDWMINEMNKQGKFNGMVRLIQPLEHIGMGDFINAQNGVYTLILRGIENGETVEKIEIITAVKDCLNPYTQWSDTVDSFCDENVRVVFSNTTEAGIEFKEEYYKPGLCQHTYPAKLTNLLYERFKAGGSGLHILPCELIEKNGATLRECIIKYAELWQMPKGFIDWVNNENTFYNTLVDRIVAGYPRNEAKALEKKLGYEDRLIDCGEIFHFFAIEGSKDLEKVLPLQAAGLNVVITDDLTPYRSRKVRFLNGGHTANVLAAMLGGLTYVDEMMKDPVFGVMVRKSINDEIYHTVNLPEDEKRFFADSVIDRFKNPFAQHQLASISLNSVSKWKVRVLPSLLDYVKLKNELPCCLAFSLAALIRFYMVEYKDCVATGKCGKMTYQVNDSPDVLNFFAGKSSRLQDPATAAAAIKEIMAHSEFWGMDLNEIPGLADFVCEKFALIESEGMKNAAQSVIG